MVQKANWFVLAAFLVITLLLSGCSSQKTDTISIPETYTGILGVDATFAPESIPPLVSTGSSISAVLLISNKGAVDAALSDSDMIITVRDTKGMFKFEPQVMDGTFITNKIRAEAGDNTLTKLAGKASNLIGSLDSITLKPTVAKTSSDDVSTGFLATVCYEYSTNLTANVCVDTSTYTFQKVRKPCDPKLALTFVSQGAPVAVKKIETITETATVTELRNDIMVTRPKFKIYIGNVGNGIVIDKNSLNVFCTDKSQSGTNKLNLVYIDSVQLHGKELDCPGYKDDTGNVLKPLTISRNIADSYILCSYTENDIMEDAGTYATPLKISISYGYTSTSNPVPTIVEKSPEAETNKPQVPPASPPTGSAGTVTVNDDLAIISKESNTDADYQSFIAGCSKAGAKYSLDPADPSIGWCKCPRQKVDYVWLL